MWVKIKLKDSILSINKEEAPHKSKQMMAKVWQSLRSPDSSDQVIRKINLKRILRFLGVKKDLICKDMGLFNLIKTIEEELLSK